MDPVARSAPSGATDRVRFSVVIPTYNREGTLPRAIASVLAQTAADIEIVVVDDGSTDNTAAVARAIDDPRVTYVGQPNRGVSAARNAGAAVATGEFLVFLDSDDELLPDAIATLEAAAAGHDLVVSGVVKVSPDRKRWRAVVPEPVDLLRSSVGRPVVDDDDLDIHAFLRSGGRKRRARQHRPAVARRNDDRRLRRVTHRAVSARRPSGSSGTRPTRDRADPRSRRGRCRSR